MIKGPMRMSMDQSFDRVRVHGLNDRGWRYIHDVEVCALRMLDTF